VNDARDTSILYLRSSSLLSRHFLQTHVTATVYSFHL
jgi:hypothetical protein